MQSMRVKSHVGNDGMVHIYLPEIKDTDVELIIIYQPVQKLKKRQWSAEFLSTYGSWQGEPLERAPQEEPTEKEQFF
ncbi:MULTISPECIES: hypothetical protein [Cyanophyceae]|uniref:Uncharacterized protein n=1 Tax=Nodularia spumigena CENA596 TaxID=1819295 RepID=A0A166JMV1_NODSP|nr:MULTISPECIES: hypothetical protein [Cyanophyceae]MDB9355092.1 hypothetical protein [Nodularia spumigena CS-587/03]KZL49907.1 hypothetical protein A2T98_10325 [Nodularia spumigena CENA596]MDB9317592.1 hypothetical protein [Nodularia spumigena CS-590/01A]MDB9322823.1 hypothetical protein [Nodularia spumigena CS-591/07A]MDB9326124.1 hypothetical protein [Nodularia spumigena CS-590/02]